MVRHEQRRRTEVVTSAQSRAPAREPLCGRAANRKGSGQPDETQERLWVSFRVIKERLAEIERAVSE